MIRNYFCSAHRQGVNYRSWSSKAVSFRVPEVSRSRRAGAEITGDWGRRFPPRFRLFALREDLPSISVKRRQSEVFSILTARELGQAQKCGRGGWGQEKFQCGGGAEIGSYLTQSNSGQNRHGGHLVYTFRVPCRRKSIFHQGRTSVKQIRKIPDI